MILAQCDDKAFGSMTFPIMFVRPGVLPDRCRPQGNHGTHVGMDARGAQQLMRIRDRTVTMSPVSTGGTVHRLGRKRLCAIEGPEGMARQQHHRFQGLTTLEWPTAALAHGAKPLG